MTAIFVSHRSSDNVEAEALTDWLGSQGHQQLFLDFDPADGIPAGVDWEQRLYQELRRCQALLIVLTPAWLESMWCRNELAIAREKGKAIFIVRVKPCDAGPLIPAIQEVDLTGDRDGALAKLARGLKEHGLDPASAFDWRPGRPIYPGLAAFDVDDAAIFFGRSEESWQVVEMLRRMRLQAVGSPKLLLITGASGSGKSSLMRAGVLARLRKEQASWIVARPFRRGGDALGALADAIAWAFPPGQRPASLETITTRLAGADGPRQLIVMVRELRMALDRPDATLVLTLDQAEEVLAAEQAADTARLLDLLRMALAEVGNEILVLATIRSDRLGDWQQHASIKATAEHGEFPFEILPLGPMPMARIGEIVRGPASYEGLGVEDELVEAIRADTNTPDALPLLAYTLRYLHDRFAGDGHLTLAEYRSFGGLEGSIRSQADAAIPIERMSEEDLRALREAFLPGLVRATGDGGFSRSRSRLATLPARAEPHLRRLIDEARLLLTDRDVEGNVTIEVAHEALLRVWPTLARWIADDAQNLRRLEALQRAASDWAQGERSDDFLIHRDHRLDDAEALVAEPRFNARLEDADREYLATCRTRQNDREAREKAARERELRAAQELAARRRAQLRFAGLAAGVLLLLLAFAGWQWRAAGLARDETENQLTRANTALAAGLWNDLDFASDDAITPAEQKVLWTLARDDGEIRTLFANQLWTNAERMQRFWRRPELVGRSLGLGWPTSLQADEGFGKVLGVLPGITDHSQLQASARTAKLLAAELSAEQARDQLGIVLGTMRRTSNPNQLQVLAAMLEALAGKLAAEQHSEALAPVLDAIKGTTDAVVIRDLARAATALRLPLTAEQTGEMVAAMLAALSSQPDPSRIVAVAEAWQALQATLTAEQEQTVVTAILAGINYAFRRNRLESDVPQGVGTLAPAIEMLAAKLAPDEAAAALGFVVVAIAQGDATNAASAAQALAQRLTEAQAPDAFGRLVNAITTSTTSRQREALAPTLGVLAGKLTLLQAYDALPQVILALKRAQSDDLVRAFAPVAPVLVRQFTTEQSRAILVTALDAIEGAGTNSALLPLAQTIGALKVKLTEVQAEAALRPVLAAIRGATDWADAPWKKLQIYAPAMQVLAEQLSANQAEAALGIVLDAMTYAGGDDPGRAVAQAADALAARLSTERARGAVTPAIVALAAENRASAVRALLQNLPASLTAEAAHAALASALSALALEGAKPTEIVAQVVTIDALGVPLTIEQRRAVLTITLAAVASSPEPTILGGRSPLQALQMLAAPLSDDQKRAALAPVLTALGDSPEPLALRALVRTVQDLGEKLTVKQQQDVEAAILKAFLNTTQPCKCVDLMQLVAIEPAAEQAKLPLERARAELAWATSESEADLWAATLLSLLPRENVGIKVAAIVEVLKYPPSAGAATDRLIDALSGIGSQPLGKEAGLAATLSWLRITYPAIDLDATPACPPPTQVDIACPGDGL